MAIGQMKNEESSRVVISSKYGFGDAGNTEKGIPGGATVASNTTNSVITTSDYLEKLLLSTSDYILPRLGKLYSLLLNSVTSY